MAGLLSKNEEVLCVIIQNIHCILCVFQLSVACILPYLEVLVQNNVSIHMLNNHLSAMKAMAVIYNIPFANVDHPKVKLFSSPSET